jgi:hypothetical protein
MRRKRIQLEHAREYDEAVVQLKQKVGESQGWAQVLRGQGHALAPACQLTSAGQSDQHSDHHYPNALRHYV